jgi:hypothetical protein
MTKLVKAWSTIFTQASVHFCWDLHLLFTIPEIMVGEGRLIGRDKRTLLKDKLV